MIDLKIAELRKRNGMTQQELGDILSVSYQTVSKWETSSCFPDIHMLAKLSKLFNVSVDALLGLVPLDSSQYRPSTSGQSDYWEEKVNYLKITRATMWNADYLKFLVREVWQISKPVEILDCGCGFGAFGLMLLPLLPKGSKYVGVDFSEKMIAEAQKLFEKEAYEAKFILSDLYKLPLSKRYDMVISQAVLRHVNDAEKFLHKMIEMTKPSGLVISIEGNREFETDGLFIDGMCYANLCEKQGLRKMWQKELEMQNRDYSVAMKIPHYMRKAGLKGIDCRMNDKVLYLEPETEGYTQILADIITANQWNAEKDTAAIAKAVALFVNHGMSRDEAMGYCKQQNEIARYLKEHREDISLTQIGGFMISYGWK